MILYTPKESCFPALSREFYSWPIVLWNKFEFVPQAICWSSESGENQAWEEQFSHHFEVNSLSIHNWQVLIMSCDPGFSRPGAGRRIWWGKPLYYVIKYSFLGKISRMDFHIFCHEQLTNILFQKKVFKACTVLIIFLAFD